MTEKDSNQNNEDINFKEKNTKINAELNHTQITNNSPSLDSSPKWINNKGEEVKEVFGFNENAELVNGRLAMIGFLMLLLTELAFSGDPATQSIFGIN